MSRQKLLIVTTVPETLATILKAQPKYLNERFRVFLATSRGPSVMHIKRDEEVPVFVVPMKRGINVFYDLYSLIMMVVLLLRLRPQAVHSYTPKAGLIAMLASKICFVPVRIHTFTGLIFPTQTGLKRRLLITIDRLICVCSSKIIPESRGVKEDLISSSITKKPLNVIGHGNIAGVDSSHFARHAEGVQRDARHLRDSLSLPKDAFVFCFIGRLNHDKGISELALAFSKIPGNAYLLLVGEIDQTAPVLPETLEILRRNSRVLFLGFLEDIRPALYISHMLVLPSYREGFPNVLLQAASMELPAIASNISGCDEFVTPSENGWLVPPRDAVALQHAMEEALVAPKDSLNEMGAISRRLIQSRFERQDHWRRMADFYEQELKL